MFKNILVAWDGSEQAKRALAEAVDLARAQDAKLTLLTVAALVPEWPGFVPPLTEEDLETGAEHILAEGTALVPEDVAASGVTAMGHPGMELLKRATEHDHDLIAMGSRGRGAVRSAVLGSVSHFVLNHGEVPVLIVRDGEEEGSAEGSTTSAA
jgi:nucleotide-binding universal stress UspA family protein